jgi:hypothetical protein
MRCGGSLKELEIKITKKTFVVYGTVAIMRALELLRKTINKFRPIIEMDIVFTINVITFN